MNGTEPNEANPTATRRRCNASGHLQKEICAFAPLDRAASSYQHIALAKSERRPDDTASLGLVAAAEQRREFMNERHLVAGDRASVDEELLDARRSGDEPSHERNQRGNAFVA
jgi:hypothetical protein